MGVVGAGQLARMTAEAASALDIDIVVLAESPDDAATRVAAQVLVGSPRDPTAHSALAARCDVVTFDHELVDLDALGDLVSGGAVVRPGLGTLALAVDKAVMRRTLGEAGLPMPAHRIVEPAEEDAAAAVGSFAEEHRWPIVIKTARGGYDGRGVRRVAGAADAARVLAEFGPRGTLLIEEDVAIEAEIAVMVARRPGGERVTWPAVETAQVDGVCREVLVPGRLAPALLGQAAELGAAVAEVAGGVGVLAVELFLSDGRLLVNEIAARPHNSGHWTIEGSQTSQFENHLRAVLDLPLGGTDPTAAAVATVNVFGGEGVGPPQRRLAAGLTVPGAHDHLYGKAARPRRKLGHVTVCGDQPTTGRERAWAAARALGTPVPEGLELEEAS